MAGNWKWNGILGVFGFVLVFLSALSNNVPPTALRRGGYGFILFFFFMFLIRFALGMILSVNQVSEDTLQSDHRGSSIDLITPEDSVENAYTSENEAHQESVSQEEQEDEDSFSPLNPPKFISADHTSEELTNAIRQMSEDRDENE